jgi:hypothetical protein
VGVELKDCLTGGFAGEVFRSLVAEKEIKEHGRRAELPRAELVSLRAMQETFMRASGCESSANVPSEPTTRILRSSSA